MCSALCIGVMDDFYSHFYSLPAFLVLQAPTPENVCSGWPGRIPCGSRSTGHAGPEPPHRGGEKDHPVGHGPPEERGRERAVHVEVSYLLFFSSLIKQG